MFSSDKWFGASPSFYNDVATQSLRFDDDSNSYLNKTLSGSSGNQKTWTYSFWFKHGSRTSLFDFLTANASGDKYFEFTMSSAQKLTFYYHDSTLLLTNMQLRDRSAWYHIAVVHDTTQDDPEDRLKIYVNGVKVTDYETNILNDTNLPEDFDGGVNETGVEHLIGRNQVGNNDLDGYLSDVYLLDGTAVGDTSGVLNEFIEIKNGICIPKKYSGSYGTHGFHFEFKQTGTGTASTSTIGADTSGQTNHYTSNGVAAHDSNMPDSPENNFATLNPLIKSGNTYSEGNLKVTTTTTAPAKFVSTIGVTSGKWFMEFRHSGDSNYVFGITSDTQQRDYLGMSDSSTSFGIFGTSSNSNAFVNGSQVSWGGSGTTWSAGDIIGLALNADDSILEVYKDGSSIGSYDYSGLNWSEHFFAGGNYVAGTYSPNFGQDSTFQGAISAGGNADGNGIGNFKNAVPSSYLALCTANLEEPTIGPNSATQADDYFNTVLYTGNGSSSSATQDISGVGFKPDFLWTKRRNSSASHNLRDSSRDANGLKHLQSDGTGSEDTESDAGVTAFLDDGFRLKGTNAGSGQVNANGGTFVAWNWKANGGTTTTNDASSTSIGSRDSVFQANTTAGFSIVTYTGDGGTGVDTYRHGLQVNGVATTPEVIICKNRDASDAWLFGATAIPNFNWVNDYMHLQDTIAHQTNAGGTAFKVAPTSTVFSVGEFLNKANNYVAYCFASVEGYSKFGSYTGNGNVNGAFVFTGFRPAWVMLKRTDSADDWFIHDSTRDTFNINGHLLYANEPNAEYDAIAASDADNSPHDFTSNGFKLRSSNANWNASSGTYIYMAFAEAPFKYANAR
jgi:hypothetical protein